MQDVRNQMDGKWSISPSCFMSTNIVHTHLLNPACPERLRGVRSTFLFVFFRAVLSWQCRGVARHQSCSGGRKIFIL